MALPEAAVSVSSPTARRSSAARNYLFRSGQPDRRDGRPAGSAPGGNADGCSRRARPQPSVVPTRRTATWAPAGLVAYRRPGRLARALVAAEQGRILSPEHSRRPRLSLGALAHSRATPPGTIRSGWPAKEPGSTPVTSRLAIPGRAWHAASNRSCIPTGCKPLRPAQAVDQIPHPRATPYVPVPKDREPMSGKVRLLGASSCAAKAPVWLTNDPPYLHAV